MNKCRRQLIAVVILCALLLSACANGGAVKEEEGAYRIYCLDIDEKQLESLPLVPEETDAAKLKDEFLAAMASMPVDAGLRCALPANVVLHASTLSNKLLTFDFSEQYLQMEGARELLCRAAYAMTFLQIDGVDQVLFTIEGAPLLDADGMEVGPMTDETFVDNSSYSLEQYDLQEMMLYFAGGEGDVLAGEVREVRYSKNRPIAGVVIDQLQKGPSDNEHGAVIPKSARLLGVSTRDDVCYLNFDQGFIDEEMAISDAVRIYAVVNSVAEATGVSRVQISVNGETKFRLHETWDLTEPLLSNSELIQ